MAFFCAASGSVAGNSVGGLNDGTANDAGHRGSEKYESLTLIALNHDGQWLCWIRRARQQNLSASEFSSNIRFCWAMRSTQQNWTTLHRPAVAVAGKARSALGLSDLPIEKGIVEAGSCSIRRIAAVIDRIETRPVRCRQAHGARLAAGVELAAGRVNVPSALQAARIAFTSPWAVGSFVAVTELAPSPTILPSRTTTAPKGPPLP